MNLDGCKIWIGDDKKLSNEIELFLNNEGWEVETEKIFKRNFKSGYFFTLEPLIGEDEPLKDVTYCRKDDKEYFNNHHYREIIFTDLFN